MTHAEAFRLARSPIAVTGVAGMFPQAADVREFWRNVMTGRDCITEVPEKSWRLADHYDSDMFAEDKTYARHGGFLPPTVFDPAEFSMPPSTLDSIGLVQLLSLQVARDVLADAGCADADWYDPSRTGVILGVCGQNTTMFPLGSRLYGPVVREAALSCGLSARDADEIERRFKAASPGWTEDSFPGTLANVVAGRIANRFGFGAANCTVDAACASSLAALRMAVSELVEHRADLMITGGCDADNSVTTFMCFSKTPALSPRGTVRPFDSSADGTLIGEGIGMLALKRLSDAERDGDRIYAVLRGLGSSSDGRTPSIYGPSGEGQLAALRRAYEDAELPVGSVQLIEAHGTGTSVGDAVELGALSTFLAPAGAAHRAAVGSVKSQIGHTKAAAGAAGLIKTALALHHKVLPPTINVDTVSEAADRDALYVNQQVRPWVREPHRPTRRGGVSAFGFGGVNFHALLEEYPAAGDGVPVWHTTPTAHLWHAPDVDGLLAKLRAGAAPGGGGPVPAGHVRLGVVAASDSERTSLVARAIDRLEGGPGAESWELSGQLVYRRDALPPGAKVAALFAGQGSQYVGMGRHALLALPPVRAYFDRANALWEPGELGLETLADVVFPVLGQEYPGVAAARLRRTSCAQAAIGALAMGQYRYLSELGFAPHGLLGHSCGELIALWAAGSLTDDGCLTLTRQRGQAMEPTADADDRDSGAMLALRASRAVWDELAVAHHELTLCNLNAPDELVVGGPTPAIESLADDCRGRDLVTHRLPVAGAFHTPLVKHAADTFARAVAAVGVPAPATPVFAGAPDASYGDDAGANVRTLSEQMLRPVDFASRVREMYADGFRVFVEFGPGQVLSRLATRIVDDPSVHVVATDGGVGTDSAAALAYAALRLAVLGLEIEDINRHQAPAPAPRAAASPVARLLEGPSFAVEARRPQYESALAQTYQCASATPMDAAPPAPAPAPAPAPETVAAPPPYVAPGPLVDAAASQLALHTQYLDGQLHTARTLAELVAGAAGEEPDTTLLAQVEAVKEHSLALSRAHIHAQDVMLELVRLGRDGDAPRGRGEANRGAGVTHHDEAGVGASKAVAAGQPGPVVPLPRQSSPGSAGLAPGARQLGACASEFGVSSDSAVSLAGDHGEAPSAGGHGGGTAWDGGRGGHDGETAATGGHNGESAPGGGRGGEAVGPDALPDPASWAVDAAQAERILRELVAEKTGYTVEMVAPDVDIQADLGIDSLKQVEIASEAWRRYPFLPREEIYRFAQARTVRELAAMLAEIAAGAAAAADQDETAAEPVPLGRGHLTLCHLPAADTLADAYGPRPTALILDDGSALADAVSDALAGQGWDVRRLMLPGITVQGHVALGDWHEETLRARLLGLLASAERLDLCVLAAGHDAQSTGTAAAVARLRHAVLVAKHVTPALKDTAGSGYRAGFTAVAQLDGSLGLAGSGGDPSAALLGGLGGLVKAVAVEEPDLFCRLVDIAPACDPATAAARFVTETTDAVRVAEVAWDGTRRAALAVTPVAPDAPVPAADATPGASDLLVVTGGARGITAWCCAALAAARSCGFVLLGRTPLRDLPAWAVGHDDPAALATACREHAVAQGKDVDSAAVRDELDAEVRLVQQQSEIRTTLAALRAQGAEASYVAADVADPAAVAAALAPYAPRVTGVIHGAGVLADKPLALKTPQDIGHVVDTKVIGLLNVLAALPGENLRHLVLFTSVSGIYGNGRQTDYAMANEALNRFACAWQMVRPACRVRAMAWGPWQGGMASAEAQALFTELGVGLLTREQGCAHFTDELAAGPGTGTVSVLGPLRSVFTARALPAAGLTVLRGLEGLAEEAVLVDHSIDGLPVLPMTAAVGWGVNVTERLRSGRRVNEVRDFRVRKGLILDGSHPPRVRIVVRPEADGAGDLRLSFHDDGVDTPLPRYEGMFRTATGDAAPPRLSLPSGPVAGGSPHPAYRDGFLFHGPLLQGLGAVLAEDDKHLMVAARMPDPQVARGAYAGALYSPALADLLLQAAALLGRRLCGHRCLPVAVERVQLFAPLPDDEPFVIVVELLEQEPLELVCTVTACDRRGEVLQRWEAVKGIVAAPQLGSRAAWPAPRPATA
ncbi:SDR family NAD(P)-dependent oxidoreductase [Streptomyces sp. NPDC006711]|uniref:SDR family NAD(P)-dependent oxidoreductase n=1 Tax=Streptomyces sp. NPDC006711 TaxID=3364762 RepID=UPI00367C03B5